MLTGGCRVCVRRMATRANDFAGLVDVPGDLTSPLLEPSRDGWGPHSLTPAEGVWGALGAAGPAEASRSWEGHWLSPGHPLPCREGARPREAAVLLFRLPSAPRAPLHLLSRVSTPGTFTTTSTL